jgi:predicted P-loop ATPase
MNQEAKEMAIEAQEDRFQVDSWEDDISKYIENKTEVAMSDVLETGLGLENKSQWTRATEIRVGNILMRQGWKRRRVREGKQRLYRYFKET